MKKTNAMTLMCGTNDLNMRSCVAINSDRYQDIALISDTEW